MEEIRSNYSYLYMGYLLENSNYKPTDDICMYSRSYYILRKIVYTC